MTVRTDPRAVTQARHPWRATMRTALAVIIGVAPVVPVIVDAAGVQGYGWAVAVVAVAAGITRIIAVPAVNAWLTRAGLGAAPSVPNREGSVVRSF